MFRDIEPTVKNVARVVVGTSLLLATTACTSSVSETEASELIQQTTPEILPQSTEVPSPTPLPKQPRFSFANEFMRGESINKILGLRAVLQEYVNPRVLDPYNQTYFDRLVTSSDDNVLTFIRRAEVDDSRSNNFDRFEHRWALRRLLDNDFADMRISFDGFEVDSKGPERARRVEISAFIRPWLLPNAEELIETEGPDSDHRIIKSDRIEQAARSIFNLPADVKWFTVPANSPMYHGGTRGLSVLPDGTLMEVRMTNYGSAKLSVSKATVHLFPVG